MAGLRVSVLVKIDGHPVLSCERRVEGAVAADLFSYVKSTNSGDIATPVGTASAFILAVLEDGPLAMTWDQVGATGVAFLHDGSVFAIIDGSLSLVSPDTVTLQGLDQFTSRPTRVAGVVLGTRAAS
jgi:hypothetical protein